MEKTMRQVKTITDKEGKEIEMYSANCNVCAKEMLFPKKQADLLESMLPFLKEKIDNGSPCIECAKVQIENGTFNLYTQEEIDLIKELVTKAHK